MFIIKRLSALIVLALLAGACGGTTTSTSTPPPQAGATQQALDTARAVCGTVPRSKFAHDFGMTTTSPTLLSARYARAYDQRIRPQVKDACQQAMLKR